MQEEQSDRLRLLPLVSSAVGVAGVVANRLVDGVCWWMTGLVFNHNSFVILEMFVL